MKINPHINKSTALKIYTLLKCCAKGDWQIEIETVSSQSTMMIKSIENINMDS